MKASLFFLSAMVLFSSLSVAAGYGAYCGYGAVIECNGGPVTYGAYLKAKSPQYQGKCLSEEQAAKAFIKFIFSPNGLSRYGNKNPCGDSPDKINGKVGFVKIFEPTDRGNGEVLAYDFMDTKYFSEESDGHYVYTSANRLEVEGSLIAFADLTADNPKIVRASTKASGNGNSNGTSQSKVGDAAYSGAIKNGMCEGSGTLSTSNGINIKGLWTANKPTGDMLVSYGNGSVYLGEYSIRPDRQRPGALISSRTGQGVLISSDGTKKRGLWFDDLYVGTRSSADKLPALKDVQKVIKKMLPVNEDVGSECDSVQGFYSKCKYAADSDRSLKDFGALVLANQLDVNVKYTDYDDRPAREKSTISSLLVYLVQSGRFSVYSKISETDEALGLLKIVLGRYKLYAPEEGEGCGDDSCLDDENFEIHMVENAAGQCSEMLIDYLEMKGIKLTSDTPDVDPSKAAKEKAEEFPVGSVENRTCLKLAQRLMKQ